MAGRHPGTALLHSAGAATGSAFPVIAGAPPLRWTVLSLLEGAVAVGPGNRACSPGRRGHPVSMQLRERIDCGYSRVLCREGVWGGPTALASRSRHVTDPDGGDSPHF